MCITYISDRNIANIQDVTFLIPFRHDGLDRLENLEIIVSYLNAYFNTTIHVLEVDKCPMVSNSVRVNTSYTFQYSDDPVFRRTEINNRLINRCQTPIAILYDTDVVIPPVQLLAVVDRIRRNEFAFALPYDGRFLKVDYYNKRSFRDCLDIEFLISGTNLYGLDTNYSVGGCFVLNLADYLKCGLENENIEGWGHDDSERVKRLQKLDYKIYRSPGPLYHLWHKRGENSYFFDETRAVKSYETYFRTCSSTKEELQKEIEAWHWTKTVE